MQKELKKYYPWFLLVAICIYYSYKAYFFAPHDFANYYYSAFFLNGGEFNLLIYDPTWFNLEIARHTKNAFAAFAPNTPFLAFFFTPLTLIPFELAKIMFNSLSLALFILGLYRLFSYYKIHSNYVLVILVIAIVPIKNNILFGQVYFLLFFLIVEGFLAYKKHKYFKMSILWSLAILLKVFPILLIIFLLMQKSWKPLIYFASTLFVLLFLSVLINGPDTWLFYFQEILPKASKGEISGEFVKNYQSILMFFKHLFIEDSLNKNAAFSSHFTFQIVLISIKLMIILLGIYQMIKRKSALEKFSFWVVAFYLLSPYSSSYGSLLLIIPFIFIVKKYSRRYIALAVLFLFLYANPPHNVFNSSNLVLSFFKLFALILFFYIFFISKKLSAKVQLSIFSSSIIVAFCILFVQNPVDQKTETTTLSDKQVAFVMGYAIEDTILTYTFWTDKGQEKHVTNIKVSHIDTDNVEIKNNRIYIKGHLRELPKSRKKNAAIINNDTLIYLSDYGRGYGFYKLIKVAL